jgi:hypothetical protein
LLKKDELCRFAIALALLPVRPLKSIKRIILAMAGIHGFSKLPEWSLYNVFGKMPSIFLHQNSIRQTFGIIWSIFNKRRVVRVYKELS